jgi:hypothetical protein
MKSFLQGKRSLPDAPLRPPAAASALRRTPALAPAPDQPHSPSVEVVKEGDKVVRLIITCSCGERIEVDCLYSGRG